MTSAIPAGKFINVAGKDIHYIDVGSGFPTLLVHGGGPGASGLSNFVRNIGPLSANRRIIVPDLPGFGKSPNRSHDGGLFEAMGDILVGLMDALGIAQANIVGNSLGGAAALKVALRHGARAKKLVLMGPGGGLPVFTPFPTEGLMRMFRFYQGEGPTMDKLRQAIELLVFDPAQVTEALLKERFEAATRPDVIANPPLRGGGLHPTDEIWRDALASLPHDTLIVWGREDRVIPLDAAFVFAKTIPNAQLHVFPRCGHWAQWEKPDAFNSLVDQFLGTA